MGHMAQLQSNGGGGGRHREREARRDVRQSAGRRGPRCPPAD